MKTFVLLFSILFSCLANATTYSEATLTCGSQPAKKLKFVSIIETSFKNIRVTGTDEENKKVIKICPSVEIKNMGEELPSDTCSMCRCC